MPEIPQFNEELKENDILTTYESNIKPYSELGKESKKEWGSWGSILVTNLDGSKERASYYTDMRVIRRLFTQPLIEHLKETGDSHQKYKLADFGGGDGVLLHHINHQLRVEPATPRVSSTLIDTDESKLDIAKQKFPELETVKASIFELPFKDDTFDLGVSRQVMQYFSGYNWNWGMFGLKGAEETVKSEQNQHKMLKEIYRVMKPDSLFELVYSGGYIDSPQNRNLSEFWNRITAARTGQNIEEVRNEREFTPGTTAELFAGEIGFDTVKAGEAGWIEWRITPESIFDRFNISPNDPKAKEIDKIFDSIVPSENYFTKSFSEDSIPLDYIEWSDQKAVRMPITKLILKKSKWR